MIKQVFSFSVVELFGKHGHTFHVNGQRLKHYYGREEWKIEDMPLEDPLSVNHIAKSN